MDFAVKRIAGTTVIALEGDLTRQPVEALVNSANEILQHNEGVATAIVRTGGRVIQEESDAWVLEHGPLETAGTAVTTGGMLHASHVIHVVGPYYDKNSNENSSLLSRAAQAALTTTHETGLSSVALPAIGTGKRGHPARTAIPTIAQAVVDWIEENPDALGEVRLVGFSRKHARLFAAALTS
jgi:putative ATPase